MKIIFKVTNAAANNGAELVGDTKFKEFYPEVNKNTKWTEVTPYIRQATEKYVLPYIGKPLYEDIADKYHSDAALQPFEEELLYRLQLAVAYYTAVFGIPKKLDVWSSMGIVNNTPNGGSAPVTQWNYKAKLYDVTCTADDFMDALMELLETQLRAGNNYVVTLWKNEACYLKGTTPIFRHTWEFQEYYPILNNRRTFLMLTTHLRTAAEKYLLPILCENMWLELSAQYQTGNLTPANALLLKKCRLMLAPWAIAECVPLHTFRLDEDGFKAISSTDGMDMRDNAVKNLRQTRIEAIKYKAEETARQFTQDLIAFLYEHAEDYPTWKASPCCKKKDSEIDCNCKIVATKSSMFL